MKFSAILPLVASALATPIMESDSRQAIPPPDQVKIISAVTSGNGCPKGTVSTSFSPDKTVATFGLDGFQTYIGPKTKPQDHSKNCQIHLNLHYPAGYQYSLMQATYHGYARLDAGVKGNFISTYFFSQAASNTATSKAAIGGAEFLKGKPYAKVDVIENASSVWSPCGATGILNINNRLALTAPSGSTTAAGEITDDDATVAFSQKVHVQWRKCTK